MYKTLYKTLLRYLNIVKPSFITLSKPGIIYLQNYISLTVIALCLTFCVYKNHNESPVPKEKRFCVILPVKGYVLSNNSYLPYCAQPATWPEAFLLRAFSVHVGSNHILLPIRKQRELLLPLRILSRKVNLKYLTKFRYFYQRRVGT